jgi:hypothetical protein
MRLATLLVLGVTVLSCHDSAAQTPRGPKFAPGTRTTPTPEVVRWIFKGDLRDDWQDHGWTDRKPRQKGDPERHLMSNYGGWILVHSGPAGAYGGLTSRCASTQSRPMSSRA